MEKLSILLKKIRERNNLTVKELAEKSKLGNGTIGDLERGVKSNPKEETLEKIINSFDDITEEEKIKFYSTITPKIILKEMNKQKIDNSIPNFYDLNKRERMQYDEFMSHTSLMFNDETISDEDKEKLFRSLQEVFFETKLRNKRKKTEMK